jgi:formyltetrahydrofolate-dependent phosphoribosylglycinamide formyltransferase
MTARARVAVLASGGGSNLQALLDHHDALGAARRSDVALVVSNRADAGALDRARARRVGAAVLADPADGAALQALLDTHGVELVLLAGYLKLVPEAVTRRYHGRMLNVHPALLPAFGGPGMYGARVHRAVLAAGARVSGATVHFVDAEYDRGAVVAQWPVPVLDGDTPDTLAARVLRVEHLLVPRAVEALAAGRVALDADGRARSAAGAAAPEPLAFVPSDDAALVGRAIDAALGCEIPAPGA